MHISEELDDNEDDDDGEGGRKRKARRKPGERATTPIDWMEGRGSTEQ